MVDAAVNGGTGNIFARISLLLVVVCGVFLLLDIEMFVPPPSRRPMVVAIGSKPQDSVNIRADLSRDESGGSEENPKSNSSKVVPFVSIVTLSAGQTYLDQNVMQNLMYQTHPHDRLELLVIETSDAGPSKTFVYWNETLKDPSIRAANKWPQFRYFFFPPDRTLATGGKRNFLNKLVKGDIVVHADNDDLAMSNYAAALVELFASSADVSKKESGKPFHVTQCCRDAPGKGPMLRNMLVQTAYIEGTFLPDGTTQFHRKDGGGKIGALTSYTALLAKECQFVNRQTQEEHSFHACAEKSYGSRMMLGEDMPGSHNQLLLRMGHPMSISTMQWFVNRQYWNQLDMNDQIKLYRKIAWWYEFLHELSRPISIPALPVKDTQFSNFGNSERTLWQDFHRKHSSFLTEGRYPVCDEYVATPGQTYLRGDKLKGDLEFGAKTARECCTKCGAVKDDGNKWCYAWTFYKEEEMCKLVLSEKDTKVDVTMSGNKNRAAWFYEFETGVHYDACKKCATGFKLPKA